MVLQHQTKSYLIANHLFPTRLAELEDSIEIQLHIGCSLLPPSGKGFVRSLLDTEHLQYQNWN